MTWGDRPDKEEYDRAQAALNARYTDMLNAMPMFDSASIAAMGMGFGNSVMSQAVLGAMAIPHWFPISDAERSRNAAQAYAAEVRARNPSMQVKRLTEPMP